MTTQKILASAQECFPKSANKTIRVQAAWKAEGSTLSRPAPDGADGWTTVNNLATYDVLSRLLKQGFTWVSLEASGVAKKNQDVQISRLI